MVILNQRLDSEDEPSPKTFSGDVELAPWVKVLVPQAS